GSSDAVGRSVRINNTAARIIGVAPAGFFGLRAGQWTDVYAPLAARGAFASAGRAVRGGGGGGWWGPQVARLAPSAPESEATPQLAALFREIASSQGGGVEPAKVPELITLPGQRGFGSLNPRDTSALWILMLLVGVLLLVVCANVANLL